MADGKTHQKVNYGFMIITAISIVLLLFLGVTFSIYELLALACGITFGFLFDPDLDLEGISMAEYRLGVLTAPILTWFAPHNREYVKKVRNFFTLLWKVFWYPYALLMPHRSPLSHLPVLADVIRITYFTMLVGFLFYFGVMVWNMYTFNFVMKSLADLFILLYNLEYINLKIFFLVGSSIMTFSHLMMDGFNIRW